MSSSTLIWPKTDSGEITNSHIGTRYFTNSLSLDSVLIKRRYSANTAARFATMPDVSI